jgi:hypothetical protein
MDIQNLFRTAIVLLALTAVGGLLLAGIRFTGKQPPTTVAMLHGLLAASGLTLLLYGAFTAGLPGNAWLGIVLLLAAALGGMVLNLRYHWNRELLPIWFVLVHAAIAVAGFLILALSVWNRSAT